MCSPTIKPFLSIVLFLSLLPLSSFGQSRLSLEQALDQALIKLSSEGTGGYQGQCIQVFIENLSDENLIILIEPGSLFQSKDNELQDLIVTSAEEITISPRQKMTSQLWTMCTQAWNASPSKGSGFSFTGMAAPGLRRLSNRIARGNYQSSTAQSAIWTLTSKEPVSTVYGIDTVETRELAEVISEELNIPFSRFTFTPRTHRITEINASLEVFLSEKLRNARLILVDETGEVVRRYFENRSYSRGFQQLKVGASHTRDSAEIFWLTLMEKDEIIYRKKVTSEDTIYTLQPLHQQAILSYDLPEDSEVEIGLYDETGRLFLDITGVRILGKGFHRNRTIAQTQVFPDQRYYLQAHSHGRILANKEVFPGEAIPELFDKRLVKGQWQIQVQQDSGPGRIALYDDRGELKRIMAEFTSLRPGTRNFTYSFEHLEGPDSRFTMRLESRDGTILDEIEIPGQ